MEDLILTSQCRRQLNSLAMDPPHALLLIGVIGIGKRSIANALAAQITVQPPMIIEPDDKGTISIETIRGLYRRTRGRQDGYQVIIVDHAEGMGIEAQNAFLKLLEEPRQGVTFILTAPSQDSLLPTITSRVQTLLVSKVSHAALQKMIAGRGADLPSQELAQILFVADGRPATLARMLDDTDAFAHYKRLMKQAKDMLAATPYERLSLINVLSKNREDAVALLEAMARMVHLQILREPNDKILELADDIQSCLARLAQNGNTRAQLTGLFAGR